MSCSEDGGDNSSDDWRGRLLKALAGECARLGNDIARLGDAVTAGQADVAALQGFDAQSQTAHGLCGLLGGLSGSRRQIARLVAQVPLPAMRQRLAVALDPHIAVVADSHQDAVFWLNAP